LLKTNPGWAVVVHTCNPSYSGGRDQEENGSNQLRSKSKNSPINFSFRYNLAWSCRLCLCEYKITYIISSSSFSFSSSSSSSLFFFLRQISMKPRLALNSESSFLYLLRAGITVCAIIPSTFLFQKAAKWRHMSISSGVRVPRLASQVSYFFI
jgi:hypothetical protein